MEPSAQSERVGIRLKRIRERLGLSLRQVEERSRQLAEKKQNPDYFISRGWLNNIENGTYTPSTCKQYTLGAIYNVHWSGIFSAFGCNLSDFGRDQAMFAPTKTQLAMRVSDGDDTIVVPLKSTKQFRLDRTSLLAKLGKIWGEVPIRLIQHLDLRHATYGFVGLSENRMFPIIRPGSIVQIDQNQRKVLPRSWKDEDDRPIYFVELRGGFLCSWCELNDGYLSAVPHPKSKCEVLRFSFPREADIVGRVIGVTMRLVEAELPRGASV
jgi:transcriptional regulator with XRE-family HTH domain